MSIRCWFGHRWSGPYAVNVVNIYGRDRYGITDAMPNRSVTEVSAFCDRCGMPLLRTFGGAWQDPTEEEQA